MAESYHTHKHKSTHGFVYLIKSDSGHYKIGKSKNPKARAGEFSLQLPFKISVVDVVECEDYSLTERILHTMCRPYHVNGEWFAFPYNADRLLYLARWFWGNELSESSSLIIEQHLRVWWPLDDEMVEDLALLLAGWMGKEAAQ